MEVDKRVLGLFCFYLFCPIVWTVIQKMQGHCVEVQGHPAGGDEPIAIKQVEELSCFHLIRIIQP